jgi:hypothetical protein
MNFTKWIAGVGLLLLLPTGAGPAHAQAIFWTDTNFPSPLAGKADPVGANLTSVALGAGTLPGGLAFDPVGGNVYWVESAFSNARVLRVGPSLGNITPVVTGGSVFRGLAVDAVNGRLYWTSSNLIVGSKIHRAGLDGSSPQVVLDFAPGPANPRGIAVDPTAGFMYWADFDLARIRRATLAGGAVTDIRTLGAGSGAWGVAVDVPSQQIYWTEYNTGTIRSGSLGGSDVTTLVSGRSNPTYLALAPTGGKLYWLEAGAGAQRMGRADLNGANVETVPIPIATYGGITFAPLVPTSVLLTRFEAGTVQEGIELRWQFGNSGEVTSAVVERLPAAPGTWQPVTLERHDSGGMVVAIDRSVAAGQAYDYRLVVTTADGRSDTFGPIHATAGSSLVAFTLELLAPNPTPGAVHVAFAVPRQAAVRVSIFDVRGREVETLVEGTKAPGRYEVLWSGTTRTGRAAAGTYYVRLEAPGAHFVRKFALLR